MQDSTLTPQQLYRKKASGDPILPDDAEACNRHVISVLLENTVGALNRVINLFSARGFNMESVTVGATDDPSVSRLTLVTTCNDRIVAQVNRQLSNLVDTLDVCDLTEISHVERELALVKVHYKSSNRAEIMDTIEIFRGKVVNITPSTLTIELTGPTQKVNAFVGLLQPFGIAEVARSGRVAMRRALPYEEAADGTEVDVAPRRSRPKTTIEI